MKKTATEVNEAMEFLNSMRGRYIMAQALSIAIKTMSEVPFPHKEVSNIADMQYLRENVFNFPFEQIHA